MKKIKHLFFVIILCLTSLAVLTTFVKSPSKVDAVTIPDGQTLDTNVDTLSVSDLTFNGLSNQTIVAENKNTDVTFSYSAENTNKSLVFKFKYDVQDTNKSDANAVNIYFVVSNSKWDAYNNLWIRGDGVHFRRYNDGAYGYADSAALTEGVHDVEFGRVALLDGGSATGNYYVYYKLDGALVSDSITPFDVATIKNQMFLNYSAANIKNRIYDANLTYETPQQIGVSSLKDGGNLIGDSITNSGGSQKLTYDLTNQPTNKSVVFSSYMVYRTDDTVQLYIYGDSGQSSNTTGYVWIQGTKTYFGLSNSDGTANGNKEVLFDIIPGSHSVEYGRLAVMNGETFTGRYHVYVKIDGDLVYAIDQALQTNISNGGYFKFSGTSGLEFTDVDPGLVVELTYEEPKEISLSDLKLNDNLIGKVLDIDGQKNLTFDNTDHTDNYSIVFKFKYEAVELKNNQVHITSDGSKWTSSSSFILNNDNGSKINLGKSTISDQDGWHNVNCQFTQGTTYTVEYGRLAIMSGENFTNKYHIYLKINDEIIKEDDCGIPTAVTEGNLVFITSDGHNMMYDINYVAPVYEEADQVSITNLSVDGNSLGDTITLSANTTYKYGASAEYKSVVYKFKYEVLDPSTVSCQFHFTDGWSESQGFKGGMIWLRNDKTFIRKSDTGYYEATKAFPTAGTYDVEMGKIYIISGDGAGKYRVYIKVNDVMINDQIFDEMPDKAALFLTGTNGDKLHDYRELDTVVDTISVSNLTFGGKTGQKWVGENVNTDTTFTYSESNTNKNLVFKFKYDVKDTNASDSNAVNVYLVVTDSKWDAKNNLWIRGDGVYFKTFDGYYKTSAITEGMHEIEYGRIALLDGETPTGQYYVYYKLDGVLLSQNVNSYDLATIKNQIFLNYSAGNTSNTIYDANFTPCNGTHTLEHTEAVAATCTTDGSKEYWYCTNCEKYFSDAEATQEIADLEAYLPVTKLGHTFGEMVAEVPATCTTDGTKAHKDCSVCNKHFDAEGNEIADLTINKLGHDLVDDAAVAPTCTETGKTAGHHCSRCDYTDGGETVEALGHDYQWMTDKEATVLETGLKHEECTRCHDKKSENTVIPVLTCEHQLTLTPAVAPTCTEAGAKAYYTCSVCHKHFSDEAGQLEIADLDAYLPVAATGHTFGEMVAEVAATCTTDGTKAHKDCSVCHKHFDAEGNEIADLTITRLGHDLIDDAAIPATCTEAGKTAGHHCSRCDYTDGGETVKALGHQAGETLYHTNDKHFNACTRCGFTLDFQELTQGTDLNDARWTQRRYTTDWETMTGQMRVREKNGSTVVNMAAGNSMTNQYIFNFEGTTPIAKGNAFSIDLGNYFGGAKPMGVKVSLVVKVAGQTQTVYVLGDANNFYNFPVTTALDTFTFVADMEVEVYEIRITNKSQNNGNFYLYMDNVKIFTAMNVETHTLVDDPSAPAVAATCTEAGHEAGKMCSCGYKVEGATIPAAHTLEKTEAKAPTLTEDGNIAYWTCSACGKKFADEAGTQEITNVVVTIDKTVDEISVSDLTIGGKSGYYVIPENKNTDTEFNYSDTNTNKNLVFKFKYAVVDTNTSDKNAVDVYLVVTDDKWAAYNNLWFRGEGNYFRVYNNGKFEYNKKSAFEEGTYDIEFGRYAILYNGESTGQYLVYYKVNGELIGSTISPFTLSTIQNKIFLNFSELNTQNKMYDIDYADPTFEEADEISIADLSKNGEPVGNIIKLDADTAYTYTSTKEHKSVIYKFKYDVIDLTTTSCQFHLTDGYSEGQGFPVGMVWLQSDKSYIRVGDNEYTKGAAPFSENGTYTVEYGKLYVTAGYGAGSYYVYIKINDTLLLDCYAEQLADKAAFFTTGKNGDKLYDIDFVPCNGTHTLEFVPAKAATCTEAGNVAYYRCSNCGETFADEAGTQPITDVTIPAAHTLTKVEAKAATCTEAGNIEYYECSVCNKKFSDANGTTEVTDVTIAASHTLTKVEAKAASCTEAGNIEHYHCSVCNKNFSDAEGTTEVADVTIAASHTLAHRDAKAATCTEAGNIEYYHCSECGKNFSDANGTTEVADVTTPAAGHKYGTDGKCSVCGATDPDYKPATDNKKKGCKSAIGTTIFSTIALFAIAGIVYKKRREE